MSARQAMRHRCTIQRNQPVGVDGWGGETEPQWKAHLTAQPCFAWYRAGRLKVGAGSDEVIEDLRLLLPVGTDVTRSDRIQSVTDRLGNQIMAGPLTIDSIGHRKDHLVLYLKEID